MKYPVSEKKCAKCSACHLVTETFGNAARLSPEDYYYACSADMESECGEVSMQEEAPYTPSATAHGNLAKRRAAVKEHCIKTPKERAQDRVNGWKECTAILQADLNEIYRRGEDAPEDWARRDRVDAALKEYKSKLLAAEAFDEIYDLGLDF